MKTAALSVLVLSAMTASGAREQIARPGAPQETTADVVLLRGCIRGGALTHVEGDQVGRTHDRTYRLTGPTEILRQIKKEHSGHYVEVTGRIHDFDDPRATVRKRKKLGKVTVTADASRGSSARLGGHEIPLLDVVSFQHLSSSCGR
jgi:hypothetical protein